MQDGIQISMQSMNHIHIASDGKTARIGGGVTSKLVADTLAAAGKQTGQNTSHGYQSVPQY